MKRLNEGAKALGIDLSGRQLGQFENYYRELVEWNRKINLTRIIDYDEVQVKHFLDSLSIAPYMETERSGLRVIDVGSGAGLPGIPLKIARPDIKLTLLEATTKKVGFLRHLIDRLELSDVDAVTGRAEEIAHKDEYREQYDLVVSRAVAELPVACELNTGFLRNRRQIYRPEKRGYRTGNKSVGEGYHRDGWRVAGSKTCGNRRAKG